MAIQRKLYRIGVDVGGTNTDSALACLSPDTNDAKVQIVASSKSQTTTDVTTGICNVIHDVLETAQVPHDDVLSINIGTTHFINAVVQADQSKLDRVAVLRLCGAFVREVPPFADFPRGLRNVIQGYVAYVSGGLEIDGRYISKICEAEIIEQAKQIKSKGIRSVVVVGVFSPLDTAEITQEAYVKEILRKHIPGVDVVCSRDIGTVGLLERENASILNASILRFGRRTIRSFESAMVDLGLRCPLYLTQNDGTVMDAHAASVAPIKTFSSGATNSLTGAVFLSGLQDKSSGIDLKTSQVIMVDIGGTTSDFAALSPSGFPRQSPAVVSIAGVRTAFSMPEVNSIGLGGGSHVAVLDSGKVLVGPTSVGHKLPTESRCFGGSALTATDIVVSRGMADDSFEVMNFDVSDDIVRKASRNITKQLQKGIELMKTSDMDVILLLVGGGSIIQMEPLDNVAKCVRPPFFNVANAVGAAIAKISGEIDSIVTPGDRTNTEILQTATSQAIELAYENGALNGSVKVMDVETIPLQYVTNNAIRVIVKAVGDLGWNNAPKRLQQDTKTLQDVVIKEIEVSASTTPEELAPPVTISEEVDLETYVPEVDKNTGEWYISETDLLFIGEGCGILGTGGGGSVYTSYLHALEVLRSEEKHRMRIVSPESLSPNSNIVAIAYAGAPSVSNERLISGDELQFAAEYLSRFLKISGYDGVMGAEIGGSNGMRPFATAAKMNIPIIDTDTMGRAFPKVDMALPYVYKKATPCPAVLSDARGNVQIIASVEDAHRLETMIRSACVELGLFTALSLAPFSGDTVKEYCCGGGLSFAWFMGREICVARKRKSDVVQSLLSVIPGGVLLYTGKIINVTREIKGGWTIGTATLEPYREEVDDEDSKSVSDDRKLILGYQNEFLYASLENHDGSKTPLCTTPDLISALDQDGTALATHEMRYGLRVSIIAMPANPLWMTEVGMKAAGPQAFGLNMEYNGLGTKWAMPESVIDRFKK